MNQRSYSYHSCFFELGILASSNSKKTSTPVQHRGCTGWNWWKSPLQLSMMTKKTSYCSFLLCFRCCFYYEKESRLRMCKVPLVQDIILGFEQTNFAFYSSLSTKILSPNVILNLNNKHSSFMSNLRKLSVDSLFLINRLRCLNVVSLWLPFRDFKTMPWLMGALSRKQKPLWKLSNEDCLLKNLHSS